MLGTILILGIIVCGFFQLTPWILFPAAITAAFIGMHFPPGKASIAKERGMYWQTLLISLPIQGIAMAALFGLGWGASVLFS